MTRIRFDPADPTTIFWSTFTRGVWRYSPRDDGAAPLLAAAPGARQAAARQLMEGVTPPTLPDSLSNRSMIDVTIESGVTRLYATSGASGAVTVTRNGQQVYTPTGYPDRVYVLGSYSYPEIRNISNGRGVLYSDNAGDPDPEIRGGTFSDLTWDSTPDDTPDGIHPDQHAIVVNPDDPDMFFEGSDGGIMRSDDKGVDESYLCDTRTETDPNTHQPVVLPVIDPAGYVNCKQHLSRVPHQLFDTLNKGLLTLQFQSISVNPDQPRSNVMGGTQDNGTFEWTSSVHVWDQTTAGLRTTSRRTAPSSRRSRTTRRAATTSHSAGRAARTRPAI